MPPVRSCSGWERETDIDEQKQLETLLQESRTQLEAAVELRTRDLVSVNNALLNEIAERKTDRKSVACLAGKSCASSQCTAIARESERAAVAREIHDELGATLTAVKMDLHWYAKTLAKGKPLSNDKLTDTGVLVDSAIPDRQAHCHRAAPQHLDHLGLWPAIEWQSRNCRSTIASADELNFESPLVTLEARGADRAVFRIVQRRSRRGEARPRHADSRARGQVRG